MNTSSRLPFSRCAPNPFRRRAGGFTIIELLVATAITALLVSLMLTVVVNVMSGWSKSSGKLNTGGQARTILTQLTADLHGAILKRDGNVWLAATIQQNQDTANGGKGDANVTSALWNPAGEKKPSGAATVASDPYTSLYFPSILTPTPDLTTYRFGQGGVWLRFFTGVSDTNLPATDITLPGGKDYSINLSAPRAVAYQIVRLPTNSTSTGYSAEYRYLLFRSEVRPSSDNPTKAKRSTFGQGYNLFIAPDGTNVNYNDPNVTNSGDAEPGGIRRPDRTQIIGNNVVDFGVRFWGRNAAGTLVIQFPTSNINLGYAATTKDAVPTPLANPPATPPTPTSGAVTGITYGFPEVAEIFVRILTDDGVKQLDLLEKGTISLPAGERWWSFVEKNSQVFTRRVDIKSQAF